MRKNSTNALFVIRFRAASRACSLEAVPWMYVSRTVPSLMSNLTDGWKPRLPNGLVVRCRPVQCQETRCAVPGVRTSQ
jgi:hypothetical protein